MIKLSTALWCDLRTDADRSAWLLLGRGVETGVIAPAIQADLAMAYQRLSLLQIPRQPLTDEQVDGLLENVIGSLPVARELIRAIERAHGITGEQE